MRFTAETRGCLKCKISSLLTRNGGRTYGRTLYGRFSQNQNFWDAWNTMGEIWFDQNSDRSDRKKRARTTSKGGPVFSKLFRLDRTDPLSFGPKFPESLVEWIAPWLFLTLRAPWARFVCARAPLLLRARRSGSFSPPTFHFSLGVLLLVWVCILPRGFYISGFNSNLYMSARWVCIFLW